MSRLLRLLPVVLASVAGILCLQHLNTLFMGDTANFVAEMLLVPDPRTFHVINPAYPLFLDMIALVAPAPARMFILAALQQLAVVLSVYLVMRIGEVAGRPVAGFVAALLVALFVPMYFYAQAAQTEALYVLYLVAGLYFLVKGWRDGRTSSLLAAGALSGLAMAQRSVGVVLPGTFVLAGLLGREFQGRAGSERDEPLSDVRQPRRRSTLLRAALDRGGLLLRRAGLVLGACALVVVLFMGKNLLQFGCGTLVDGSGLHLFGRIAVVDRWLPDTPEAHRLMELAGVSAPEELFFRQAGWHLQYKLMATTDLDEHEVDDLLRTVAVQALLGRPWHSLHGTLRSISDIVRPPPRDYALLWGGLLPENFDAYNRGLEALSEGFLESMLKMRAELPPYQGRPLLGTWIYEIFLSWERLTMVWRGLWVLPAMALLGLLGLLRRNFPILLLTGVAFGQLLASSIGDNPIYRYWDTSIPPFILALCLSVPELLDVARRRWIPRQTPDIPTGAAEA